jgi:myo-inositol-1(or 4)-monophosphatase
MEPIERLKAIALEAGKLVRDGYDASKEVTHKGVVDLVTEYDVRAEQFIIKQLGEYLPEYTPVGEESYEGVWELERAIYIDPIDGTTNFIHGIPHLGISLGVWEDGVPVMAVVYNPILNELFWAEAGKGAYCNDAVLHVSIQEDLQQSLIATGFPYAKVEQGAEYHWVIDVMTSLLPHIRDIRRLGAAAIDLCYLAQGRTDAFYEIDLKPWDVAAGILIVQEAGGHVSNLLGEPYGFDDKGIVVSNGKVHGQLLEHMKEVEIIDSENFINNEI